MSEKKPRKKRSRSGKHLHQATTYRVEPSKLARYRARAEQLGLTWTEYVTRLQERDCELADARELHELLPLRRLEPPPSLPSLPNDVGLD